MCFLEKNDIRKNVACNCVLAFKTSWPIKEFCNTFLFKTVWTNFYSSFHLIAFTFHFNCKCFALACFFSLPHQHSSCIKLIQKKIWSRNQILKNGGAQDPERKWIESHCAQCKIRGAYDLEPELCFQRVLVLKIKCNYSF